MKNISRYFLLAALGMSSWHTAYAVTDPFGTAGSYNKFILGDVTHYGGDSEGPVAIAGNAVLTNYGIADRTQSVTTGLVVGGSLTQTNGQTFGGNVHVGGSVYKISTILHGSLYNPSTPINFAQEGSYLLSLSNYWNTLTGNGTLNLQSWGGLELTGTNTALNVFYISESVWKQTRQINLNVPASSSVVINVAGTGDTIPSDHSWFGAMFMNNSTNAADWQKVVWNFPDMTSFSIRNIGWKGTLFAPKANFSYASGNVEGHLIVKSISALEYSAETHWYPFKGDLPVPPVVVTPEPETPVTPTEPETPVTPTEPETPVTETPVCESKVYAVHDGGLNNSQLFTVDPLDGFKVAALGTVEPAYDLEALDIQPSTNKLYTASGDDTAKPGHLYEVDKATGTLTDLGSTGIREVDSLSFSPDGKLWGWAQDAGLFVIDNPAVSPVATVVLPSNGEVEVEDISWNLAGTVLYGVQNKHVGDPDYHTGDAGVTLWKYETATGSLTTICPDFAGSVDEIEALETLPDGSLAFGFHGKTTMILGAINPETCQVVVNVEVPSPYYDIEGIAWPDCQ